MLDKISKKFLENNGYIVFANLINEKQVLYSKWEIITHLENLPRADDGKIRIRKIEELSLREQEALKKVWTPNKTLGDVSEPPAYHLLSSWMIRQNPKIVKTFSAILETDESNMRVTIDRYKAKLPRSGGQKETPHYNSNPEEWDFSPNKQRYRGFIAYSKATFFLCPKTHTKEFQVDFLYNYRKICVMGSVTKVDPNNDPLDICGMETAIELFPGDMLVWNDKLASLSYPHTGRDIIMGLWLSYERAGQEKQSKKERVESYITGMSPKIQPYGKPFNYMPEAWGRFIDQAKKYHSLIPEKDRKYENDKPIIEEPDLENYNPPRLTELGYMLLWGKPKCPIRKIAFEESALEEEFKDKYESVVARINERTNINIERN